MNSRHYPFLKNYLTVCTKNTTFNIKVKYITQAGNFLDKKVIALTLKEVEQIESDPRLYMTKKELNEIEKDRVEEKKKETYEKVNSITLNANLLKDNLIVKKDSIKLDELIANLFDRTVNSIWEVKKIDSDEFNMILKTINDTQKGISKIEEKNKKLNNYYSSEDFLKIKETCDNLMMSQKDFNIYIEQKISTLQKLFGTRISRGKTIQEDTYNYIRPYKKSITPFTAELSSSVFSSAENKPIEYLIKYFYPNKNMYKEQIINLKNLLNELDTLAYAKEITNNYKKYLDDVPKFVLDEDEDGFFQRLGFTIIDEAVLNIEYKFVYTSNGGMAQRSFSIPMSEETISELINTLQNKLSLTSLAKEQRALMTSKLRLYIKQRDDYTCAFCGNSTYKEPNLLLEIDHKIPIAKGGLSVEDNLQTLCWKCNRNKGAKII